MVKEEECLSTFDEQVAHYLQSLSGPDFENAYHGLIELGPDGIPYLENECKTAIDTRTRTTCVRIASSTHSLRAIPLLREALDQREAAVWKEALDGLVSLGGHRALEVMHQVRARTESDKAQWLDEAIQQIAEKL